MKTLIILNPSSANKKTMGIKDLIESEFKKLKIDYCIHISKSLEDIIDVTKKNLKKDFSSFIAVGGDGTIHYMANVLAGTNKNLGAIPTGSGNDITTTLGLPTDIKKCCQIIKKSRIRRIDLGLINDKYYYMAVAGSGFDSEVNDLANNTRFPIKGPSKYTYAVYKTLISFKSKKFLLSYNNKQKEVMGMMIAAANMSCYGGGMRIAPLADCADGLLDICVIKRMSKIHFIKIFPKVYTGKHVSDSHVEIFKTNCFTMDSEYRFSVFADGEYICKLPASFKIVPRALNFIVSS